MNTPCAADIDVTISVGELFRAKCPANGRGKEKPGDRGARVADAIDAEIVVTAVVGQLVEVKVRQGSIAGVAEEEAAADTADLG